MKLTQLLAIPALIISLSAINIMGMERPKKKTAKARKLRLALSLKDICARSIVAHIKQTQDASVFNQISLPEELYAFLRDEHFINTLGPIFWKKNKDKTAIKTIQLDQQISQVATSADSNYIIITHPSQKSTIIDINQIEANNLSEIAIIDNAESPDKEIAHQLQPIDPSSETYKAILKSAKFNVKLPNHHGNIAAKSPNKKFIVTGINNDNRTCSISIYDAKTKDKIHTLSKYFLTSTASIDSIAITSDSNFIITSHTVRDYDGAFEKTNKPLLQGKIVVWDAKTGKALFIIKNKILRPIETYALSKDDSLLVIGYTNGCIDIVQMSKKNQFLHSFKTKTLATRKEKISSIAISPDNKSIVIGYYSGLVKLIALDSVNINLRTFLTNVYKPRNRGSFIKRFF